MAGISKNYFWSGYEDNEKVFQASKSQMQALTQKEREELAEEAFAFYRTRNVLPIRRLTEVGIKHEIESCLRKEVSFQGNHLNEKSSAGTTLCKHFCENFWTSTQGGNSSVMESFTNDKILKKTIEWIIRTNLPPTPANIYSHVRLVGGNIPSVLLP
jgi:hypothetical protein